MKAFLALGLVAAFSNPAFAEVPCDGGKLDIFKFVKWDFKTVNPDETEITLTVHNATDHDFKESKVKFRWGEWHQFFFNIKTLAKAGSDVTFVNSYGMPAKDAQMLQAMVPTLCTVTTIDENDNREHYD